MAEYIEKWSVVNRLIELENEFQQYKPFHGFEHAMYRKLCEAEIAIGKTQAADVAPVVRCRDCKHYRPQKKSEHWENRANYCNRLVRIKVRPNDFCSYGERKNEVSE